MVYATFITLRDAFLELLLYLFYKISLKSVIVNQRQSTFLKKCYNDINA